MRGNITQPYKKSQLVKCEAPYYNAPMSNSLSNKSPDNPGEKQTRQRIVDAALVCLDRWGLEKTSLHDIAREAGVTRPTVYSYFANREQVIQAAMIHGGEAFGLKLLQHINQYRSQRERLLEAVLFAWKYMPKEPYLKLVQDAGLAHMINEQAITSQAGREICRTLFEEILQHDPKYQKDLDEITEVTTRFLLSLLLVEGATRRDEKQMRDFLERRLLPAVGF